MRNKHFGRLLLASIAMLALAFTVGCSRPSPLIGKWQGVMGALGQFTIEFKPDGTLSQTSNGGLVTITGTYSTSGDTLNTSEDSASVAGRNVPLPPGSAMPANCKYVANGNSLTLRYGSNSTTLTKVK